MATKESLEQRYFDGMAGVGDLSGSSESQPETPGQGSRVVEPGFLRTYGLPDGIPQSEVLGRISAVYGYDEQTRMEPEPIDSGQDS